MNLQTNPTDRAFGKTIARGDSTYYPFEGTMMTKLLAGCLLAVLTISGLPTDAVGQLRTSEVQIPDQPDITVFKVMHRDVNDIGNSLRLLLESDSIRIASDRATNSLIISHSGRDGELKLKAMEGLLKKLDVKPVPEKSESTLRSYQLDGVPHSTMLVVETIMAGRNVRMQATPGSNSLVLMGEPEDHELLTKTLEALKPVPKSETGQLQFHVAVTFLVSGKMLEPDFVKNAGKLSEKQTALLAKAEAKGLLSLEQPIVAAKTLNRVVTQNNGSNARKFEFQNSSTSTGQTFELRVKAKGQASSADSVMMNSDFDVTVGFTNNGTSPPAKSQINSDIQAKFGVPIILSFSKINGLDTAIILEVVDASEPSE